MDEKQLLEECLAGKRSAQKRLYDNYSPKMYGVCLRYASQHVPAEDILQEGFIKVFLRLDSFRSQGSLEGWIRKIMVNTALELLRKNNVLKYSTDLEMINSHDSDVPDGLCALNAKELIGLIGKLPVGFRTVFNLFAIEGFSHKEIAEMLGIAEGTSKSQYSRAKTQLTKQLTESKN